MKKIYKNNKKKKGTKKKKIDCIVYAPFKVKLIPSYSHNTDSNSIGKE